MVRRMLAGLAAAALVLPFPAFAHAKLLSSSPGADTRLESAPRSLTLKFNENVQLAVLKLTADGKPIPVTFDRGAAAAPQVSVALPALVAGTYQVQWSALSTDDGHIVRGAFSFVIAGRS